LLISAVTAPAPPEGRPVEDLERPGDLEPGGGDASHYPPGVVDIARPRSHDRGPDVRRPDNDAAITSAFELYHTEIYSFLRRSTREDEAAEDLLQEAFTRLFAELRAGRVPDNTRAWLYRVASNLAIDRGRRRSSVLRFLAAQPRDAASTSVAESPEADFVRRERRHDLERVLATLPAEARTALLLSSEGFSGTEIAEAIGRSHGATRTLLVRARRRMRTALEQEVQA
jgi:RNA polymerase sigma factor (sigma-70 family)